MIRKTLLTALVVALAFAAGFYFQQDRRHHRERGARRCGMGRPDCAETCRERQVELYNLITVPRPDTQTIFAKIDEIAGLQKEVQKQTVRQILAKMDSLPPDGKIRYLDRLNESLCDGKGQRGCRFQYER